MCGIALAIGNKAEEYAAQMERSISSRGTTSYQYRGEVDPVTQWSVSFAHLPIVAGKFEQEGVDGQKLFMNGYISNYKELAEEHMITLNNDSDTELAAELLYMLGYKAFSLFNGFFSIVWFNGKRWYNVTDRWGIKQLYDAEHKGTRLVASNVKAILTAIKAMDPTYEVRFNKDAVNDWRHSLGVIYTSDTIYEGIYRVPPLMGFSYFSNDNFKRASVKDISYEDAKTKLKELWMKSIERNKCDHLETGVFLSGGIDSGMIARHIDTDYAFSVDYLDAEYSEIETIKENSRGIHLTLLANEDIYKIYRGLAARTLDDPRVGSCYTNFALTELASRFAVVLYSGAGGDELFGGYPHRNNRAIKDVVKRTQHEVDLSIHQKAHVNSISHLVYDMKYLRGIFVVEDRMGGEFAMETRYPFMDNDFAEFALRLPLEYVENKRILKDISGLKETVLNAKKRGFSNPHCTNDEWVDYVLKTKGYEFYKEIS